MIDWLQFNTNNLLTYYTDIGHSHSSALDLLNKHDLFLKNCFVSFKI
jgi:hypothetical protein